MSSASSSSIDMRAVNHYADHSCLDAQFAVHFICKDIIRPLVAEFLELQAEVVALKKELADLKAR